MSDATEARRLASKAESRPNDEVVGHGLAAVAYAILHLADSLTAPKDADHE